MTDMQFKLAFARIERKSYYETSKEIMKFRKLIKEKSDVHI